MQDNLFQDFVFCVAFSNFAVTRSRAYVSQTEWSSATHHQGTGILSQMLENIKLNQNEQKAHDSNTQLPVSLITFYKNI